MGRLGGTVQTRMSLEVEVEGEGMTNGGTDHQTYHIRAIRKDQTWLTSGLFLRPISIILLHGKEPHRIPVCAYDRR